uniref:Large ribosomal subunit protein bL32c n=1 Tax=Helicosporidium sp. subsp. Simulium jonesii TaxID=145475 RepID=RK32_HELSJ|nr:ribosomal protein L32 [Helicosporidium sp. ex Simulium jonesi]Q2EEX8.1 RecName: Full=Large ribosomal subunit protein bL32c; AltName: Full=50S ribosomal protein L32, plastid [Helicosporidium sp. ex Simulium jonesi]ABD33965.1 ribosomal protein L32 [Helicosporidium sp. ex Simulium jonesi]
MAVPKKRHSKRICKIKFYSWKSKFLKKVQFIINQKSIIKNK